MDTRGKNVRSRRAHPKSRGGCQTCKRRKVKCDEKKPICGPCKRHSANCDFESNASSSKPAPEPRQPAIQFIQERVRASESSAKAGEKRKRHDNNGNPSATEDTTIPNLEYSDFKLFENIKSTGLGLGDDEDSRKYWSEDVVKIAHLHPFLMHLLLALSALHLKTKNDDYDFMDHDAEADRHHFLGLSGMRKQLSELPNYLKPLSLGATLVCFFDLAKGPRPGSFLVFDINTNAPPSWLLLFRGLKSINEKKEKQEEATRPTVAEAPTPWTFERRSSFPEAYGMALLISEIKSNRDLSTDKQQIYMKEAYNLRAMVDALDKDTEPGKGGRAFQHVFGWLYRVHESFEADLMSSQLTALNILGHWVVWFKHLEWCWLMKGWHDHIMYGLDVQSKGGFEEELGRGRSAW